MLDRLAGLPPRKAGGRTETGLPAQQVSRRRRRRRLTLRPQGMTIVKA
jgi:hypothetical protein